ncbi:MAG: NADH-quinone oxidoreductase subunit C [Alphaproteobacteria bacterium]
MSDPTNDATEPADALVQPSSPVLRDLLARFAGHVLAVSEHRGDATAIVDRAGLIEVLRHLREDPACAFDMLVDLTAVDYLGRRPRFEVVYHLLSLERGERVRVKVPVEEGDAVVPSAVPIWAGADWLERETWDLYGVRFEGHPGLKRIYLYDEFEGHPLRKDYPKEKRQPLIGPGAVRRDPMNDDLTR